MYSAIVIVSARCPCRPPLKLDATDIAFSLNNSYKLISPYLVSSPIIFKRIGVRKSVMTPSTIIVAPAIMSHSIGEIDGVFVLWDNLSNLLKI